MTNRNEKQKKTQKEFIIAAAMLAVLLAAVVAVVVIILKTDRNQIASDVQTAAPQMPYDVPGFTMLEDVNGITFDNGLQVLCAGSYSGFYLEDGSDETVQDVLAIVVRNNSASLVEYGEVVLPCGNKTATFDFSGLPVGAAVLVQEKEQLHSSDVTSYGTPSCTQCALPGAIVLDFGSDFELHADDGVVNVKNISDRDFTGDVSVFYKNYEYGLFIGGITYRARVSGGIKAGEIGQSLQKHYWKETSTILYMAYGE